MLLRNKPAGWMDGGWRVEGSIDPWRVQACGCQMVVLRRWAAAESPVNVDKARQAWHGGRHASRTADLQAGGLVVTHIGNEASRLWRCQHGRLANILAKRLTDSLSGVYAGNMAGYQSGRWTQTGWEGGTVAERKEGKEAGGQKGTPRNEQIVECKQKYL